MNNATIENEILNDALKVFREEMHIEIEKANTQTDTQHRYDANVELRRDDYHIKFNIEVKANINNANLGNIANKIKNIEKPALLVTKYINPQLAGKLKNLDIQFLDTAGNAYINLPPIYIWTTGKKIDQVFTLNDRNATWGPAKLQVIYALLCHPHLENKNYRTIAQITNTALGTVNWTFRDLNLKGYLLVKNKKQRKLVDKRKLLNRWVELYAEKLRPRTLLGRYEAKDNINDKQLNIIDYNAQWGGEVAAAKLTNYLRPGEYTIYTDKMAINELIFRLKLIKNPTGNVELRQRFWGNDPIWGMEYKVHPILVYADLMATAERRNIETAKVIYERYILRYLECNK